MENKFEVKKQRAPIKVQLMTLCQDVCYGPEPSNEEFVGTVLAGIRKVESMLSNLPGVTLKVNSET